MTVLAEPAVDDTPDAVPAVARRRPRWLPDVGWARARAGPRRRRLRPALRPQRPVLLLGRRAARLHRHVLGDRPPAARGRVAARLPGVVALLDAAERSAVRALPPVPAARPRVRQHAGGPRADGVPRRHVLRRDRHGRRLLRGARGRVPTGVRRRRRRRRRAQHPHALLPQPLLADPRRRRRVVHVVHRRAAARAAQAVARTAGDHPDVPVHDVRLPARGRRPASPSPPSCSVAISCAGHAPLANGCRWCRGSAPERCSARCRGCSPSPTCRTCSGRAARGSATTAASSSTPSRCCCRSRRSTDRS